MRRIDVNGRVPPAPKAEQLERTAAKPARKRPPGRPRKIEPEILRERVLSAATDVFGKEGFSEVSSDRIAELSGIPRQTIYRMFGSKHGVFAATVERALGRIVEHVTQSITKNIGAHGREVTSLGVRAFLDFVAREPNVFRMLQLAETAGSLDAESAARSTRRRIEAAVAANIRQTWEGRRPLSDREARLGGRLLVAVVESGAADYLENKDFPADRLGEYLIDFIRTGFSTLREMPPDAPGY